MKKSGKLTALMLTVVLCLSMLGAAFCIAEHTFHKCTGAECSVCAVLSQCQERLQSAGAAASAAVLLLFLLCCAERLPAFETREAVSKTPVLLKVKLLA